MTMSQKIKKIHSKYYKEKISNLFMDDKCKISDNKVKEKKKIYQKWWFGIVILIVIIGIYFIINYRLFIDTKYCNFDFECIAEQGNCRSVNIYHFYNQGPWGCIKKNCEIGCSNNICGLSSCRPTKEDLINLYAENCSILLETNQTELYAERYCDTLLEVIEEK